MTAGPEAPGSSATLGFEVAAGDTAAALGSGDVDLLATPRLLAWCEAATCAAVAGELAEGSTSVGTEVWLRHLTPTRVGTPVRVTAALVDVAGRRLRFEVSAVDDDGRQVATGEVERAVVDAARFGAGGEDEPPGPQRTSRE